MRHQACATGGRSIAVRFTAAATIVALTLGWAAASNGQLSQGPLPPAAVVDDGSIGGAGWFPASNAILSDNQYAQAAPAGSPTHYLKATNFGFSIPAPAAILGIEVLVERKSTSGTIADSRARIVKGGVIGTAERAQPGAWSTTESTVTYGTPSDLWGETWTPADINSTGFGFALSVDDSTDLALVDQVRIKVTYSLCASAPAAGCRSSGKSVLVIKNNANDAKDKLTWKWIKGQNTSTAEFGDPASGSATYALCLYDNGALLDAAVVANGAGWTPISTKGFKFLDKSGAQDGVQKIILKASTSNKAKALVKGKGSNLPDGFPPPLTGPVTVQLVNSQSGICWESVMAAPFSKNVAGNFKDKTP
jgi:hypothetical protein